MDWPAIYALVVGGLLLLFTVRGFGILISTILRARTTIQWLCTWVYPYFIHRHRFVHPVSRLSALLQAAYWIFTLTFNIVDVHSMGERASRAGSLALFNLVPLYLGGHLGTVAYMVDLPLRTLLTMHKSLGAVAVTQSIAHVVLQCLRSDRGVWNLQNSPTLYGLVVWPCPDSQSCC